jgi:hypothetical protein
MLALPLQEDNDYFRIADHLPTVFSPREPSTFRLACRFNLSQLGTAIRYPCATGARPTRLIGEIRAESWLARTITVN